MISAPVRSAFFMGTHYQPVAHFKAAWTRVGFVQPHRHCVSSTNLIDLRVFPGVAAVMEDHPCMMLDIDHHRRRFVSTPRDHGPRPRLALWFYINSERDATRTCGILAI